jgi:hypothetical protein
MSLWRQLTFVDANSGTHDGLLCRLAAGRPSLTTLSPTNGQAVPRASFVGRPHGVVGVHTTAGAELLTASQSAALRG